MRSTEVIVSGIFLALAGVVLVNAIQLGSGWGMSGPESGFFPFWLALILGVASLLNIFQALRTAGGERAFISRTALAGVLKVGLSALAYVMLTEFVGIYVASALFLACFMRWLAGHGWSRCIAVGLGVPAVIFVLFEKWFLIPLPKGVLERFLSL